MRRLFWIFVLLVLLLIAGAVAAVVMAIEKEPRVAKVGRLSPGQVERAVTILRANDPRRLKDSQVGTVQLTDTQIGLAVSYALGRFGASGAEAQVSDGALRLTATARLPDTPLGRYLNVDAEVVEGEPLPHFRSLRIGRVTVPRWLGDVAMNQAISALHADADARAASEMIRALQFNPGRMRVTYQWKEGTVDRLRARLIPEADQARMRAYNDHLVRVARDLARGAGLQELLGPLLVLASERSAGGDPAAENRAALVVLEASVNSRDLGMLVPVAREWPRPRRLSPTLQGRRDFSQHFMTSAVVAALAGTELSDAIGLYKEVEDSRGGSGFSFTDLAADRAGTRFGEKSVRSASDARAVQEVAARWLADTDLLPPIRDLPEHMNESQFSSRYGGLDDPRYAEVAREIERRLDQIPLYR